jgi:hypothetical protein
MTQEDELRTRRHWPVVILPGVLQGRAVRGESFPEPESVRPDDVDIGPEHQE